MKTSITTLLCLLGGLSALSGCGDEAKEDGVDSAGRGGSSGKGGKGGSSGKGASGGKGGSSGKGGSTSRGGSSGESGEAGEAGQAGRGETPTAGAAGEASSSGGSGGSAGSGEPSEGGAAGSEGPVSSGGSGGDSEGGTGGAGVEEPEPEPFYHCQASEQAFVRRAITGVLGRRAVSQAEVLMYSDLIDQIDLLDGVDPDAPPSAPGTPLKHSRKVFLNALFQSPEYHSNWDDLYRDFLRVQRVDELQNAACYGLRARTEAADAAAAAAFVRNRDPLVSADGVPPTMADVIAGSLVIDDMTPMYTANLFGMVAKTYAGANGEPVASELGRRRDFGAWFDSVYLNRDPVCLNCHNSEFSVTQSNNPLTNRHFPIPALLEKSLFGSSTGPAVHGGFEAGDRMHAPLKFARMVNNCRAATNAQLAAATNLPTCAAGDPIFRCTTASTGPTDFICASTFTYERSMHPWGLAASCGNFTRPDRVSVDLAAVEARFGNVVGLRSSVWDLSRSLRSGFDKLRSEGLGVQPNKEVPDPDRAFAYLAAMNIVEKVWREVTGTPLTIQSYFPRNAAARDQLQQLTDSFVASGYSQKALIETIFSSPYLNLSAPDAGCGVNAYTAPRIFDPWVTADNDPVKHGNSAADGAVMLSARTVARATYGALDWPLAAYGSLFPNVSGYGQNSIEGSGAIERQFQTEVGFFLKNTDLGFRGFDFQARLGWEDRLGQCRKLPLNTQPDVIDELIAQTSTPGVGTLRNVVEVLKDRFAGQSGIDDELERPALEAILGASLDADASTLANADERVRRVCGVLVAAPQSLLTGIAPPDSSTVPALTPASARYGALCEGLASVPLLDGLGVACAGDDEPLIVTLEP